jgi:hypothetical protein
MNIVCPYTRGGGRYRQGTVYLRCGCLSAFTVAIAILSSSFAVGSSYGSCGTRRASGCSAAAGLPASGRRPLGLTARPQSTRDARHLQQFRAVRLPVAWRASCACQFPTLTGMEPDGRQLNNVADFARCPRASLVTARPTRTLVFS